MAVGLGGAGEPSKHPCAANIAEALAWPHMPQPMLGPSLFVCSHAPQRAYLQRRWGNVPLQQREPRLVFRGRVFTQARDALRRAFVSCPALLEKAGRKTEAALFNLDEPAFIPMNETCAHRRGLGGGGHIAANRCDRCDRAAATKQLSAPVAQLLSFTS